MLNNVRTFSDEETTRHNLDRSLSEEKQFMNLMMETETGPWPCVEINYPNRNLSLCAVHLLFDTCCIQNLYCLFQRGCLFDERTHLEIKK